MKLALNYKITKIIVQLVEGEVYYFEETHQCFDQFKTADNSSHQNQQLLKVISHQNQF